MFQSDRFPAGTRVRRDGSLFWYALRRGMGILRLWRERLEQRHALSKLDADQLRDAGLNEEMIRREIEKPFWRE